MENEKEKKEKNKQKLLDALKALRECRDIATLSDDHTEALYNASAQDLYEAYVQIDTFDVDKCCSFENPYCAYGLCCAGTLATAALCGTVWPFLCNNMPSAPLPSNTPPIVSYHHGYGVGQAVIAASLVTLGPVIGGVAALNEHETRAKKKEEKMKKTYDYIRHGHNVSFYSALKKIISFHSYNDTERERINTMIKALCERRQQYIKDEEKLEKTRQKVFDKDKSMIQEMLGELCKKRPDYEKEIKESNNNNATIDNGQEKAKISI